MSDATEDKIAKAARELGRHPREGKCAAQVSDHDSRWPHYYPCDRAITETLSGIGFCKTHANKVRQRAGVTTGETIYVVNDGVLKSIGVVSRTAKCVKLADWVYVNNNYCRQVTGSHLNHIYATPREAWLAYAGKTQQAISKLEGELIHLREELRGAEAEAADAE